MAKTPAFKIGDLASIDRFGFPGMPLDTPVVIVEVKKAGKREDYQHRYRVMSDKTREAWAYEEDLRLTRDAIEDRWTTCSECEANFKIPEGGVFPEHKFRGRRCEASGQPAGRD